VTASEPRSRSQQPAALPDEQVGRGEAGGRDREDQHRDVDEQARTDWPEIARTGRGPRAAARARRDGTDRPAR
jgi:hypothetical protein